MLAIMVPVLFAFIGFAVDLGRMYLIRGELQTAADAMAVAAAMQLTGTESALENASNQARLTYQSSNDLRNRYNFGEQTLAETNGFLSNEVPDPAYFATAAAVRAASSGGGDAGGTTARYARVSIKADAPLLFFGFLNVAQERRTAIAVASVAGISVPLCTVCGIEPYAIAALDPADELNFGFLQNTKYTFGFYCNTGLQPGPLDQGGTRIQYLLLNRYDPIATIFADERSQAFRIGAQGLPPSNNSAMTCMRVNSDESVWVSAAPVGCMINRPPAVVTSMLCGIASRFETAVPLACNAVPEIDTMESLYAPDTDLADIEDYATYVGSGRRVITVPIVTTLTPGEPMQVLGFRQFLVEPNPNDTTINSADMNGRFLALYLGSPVPLKQGSFEGCTIASGPGKVVLHR